MGRDTRPLAVVFVFLFLMAAGTSWADGGFLGKRGDIAEPDQKAVILFSGGVEDLIIQVQYEGAVNDFAWLVPLPAKPEVSVVEGNPFPELRRYVSGRSLRTCTGTFFWPNRNR